MYTRDRVRYVSATRTSGSVTLNQTAITAVDSGIDLVIAAKVGDRIEVGLDCFIDNQAVFTNFDVYTMVSGSRVNPLGAGLSASIGSTTGVQAWRAGTGVAFGITGGPPPYAVQSGDLSSGDVTLRLHYAQNATTSRTLFATANAPLTWWVFNYGQPA